ncbi:tandem-95 repeat protein [Roseivirga pacifica]|uniref:tandem-95 repeat protein n=1 Tax=Roseivirga pacifica TaxID=1267423 RepID=UPI0020952ED8|nr:Ig-like domain-containing protein [Roseivirga pacifica]MCO6359901.1 tandem-95 repeat protein [Roseivirga pacifica]MCO6367271.1 tandem-95 repeat protein [Roseivirga pacifica]MCO6370197.1 tandem-95 repeat protein [Roseivirga pacifica]MCO6374928.1 tandem-95 repeat protein [Roseivirga pacifica]MCO6380186.1 tandem-95 repeat protein [Roseivirga pacifica]
MISIRGISKRFRKLLLSTLMLGLCTMAVAQEINKDSVRNLRMTTASGKWISGGINNSFISVGQFGASTVLTATDGQTEYKGSIGFAVPLFMQAEPNNAPVAVASEERIFVSAEDPIVLEGFDPDGDIIAYQIVAQPALGELSLSGTTDFEFNFTPSGSLTPGTAYQDELQFKVIEVDGEKLSSETVTYKFQFNVTDKPHNITEFVQTAANAADKSLALSFSDNQFNASYDVSIAYINLSDPTAPFVETLIERTFQLDELTAEGNVLSANFNVSAETFPFLFSAEKVFITASVSSPTGFTDDDAFVMDNEATGDEGTGQVRYQNVNLLTGNAPFATTSDDGMFFTFATKRSTQENTQTELNLYAVELGEFDLTDASIEITEGALYGTTGSPALVKSSASLAQWSLLYTPQGEKGYLDSLQFSVTSTDRGTTTETYAVVQVVDVNDAPTLASIPNQRLSEDGSLTVDLTFADVDNEVSVSVTSSNGTNVPAVINGNQLVITPAANFSGSANLTVKLIEVGTTELYAKQRTFKVIVDPVNDSPVLAAISSQTIDEDNVFTYTLSTTDIDAALPVFDYNVTPNIQGVASVSVSGNLLTITPQANYNGVVNFSVVADDRLGTSTSLSESQSFDLTINAVNDAPSVSQTIQTQNVVQGFPTYTLDLAEYFEDVETASDQLTYSLAGTASTLFTLSVNNNLLSVTPIAGQTGTENIQIDVTDGELSASQTVTFNLENQAADIQVANALADVTLDEDFGQHTIDISNVFIDANDANAVFSFSTNGLTRIGASIVNNELVFNSPSDFNGTEEVYLIATANGKTSFLNFNIQVNAVNDAPTLGSAANQTIQEDFSMNGVYLSFEDIDNSSDQLTFSAVSSNTDLLKNESIVITEEAAGISIAATPEANASGSATITVTVSDGELSAASSFVLAVNSINDAPTVIGSSLTDATEDAAYSFDVSTLFTDIDGDALSFTLAGAPTWLSVNGQSILGTPSNDDVGSASFNITADDGSGGTVTQSLTLTTANTNDAPTILSTLPDVTATEDVLLSVALDTDLFEDVDGDNLTYSASFNNATWLSFDATTNRFTGTPDNDDVGSITATVTATDGNGGSVSQDITINVENVNDAPSAVSLSALTIAEDAAIGTVIGSFSSTDVDAGDSHTYTFVDGTGGDDNAAFSINGATFSTIEALDFETQATYTVRVRTTDAAGATYDEQVTITVTNVNEAPTALSLSATSISENNTALQAVGAFASTDEDAGDTFTYSLVAGTGDTDNDAFEISNGELLAKSSLNFEEKASYAVRIKTTDAGGLSYESEQTITVTNVNEAPTAIAISANALAENADAGTEIGAFSSTDEDAGDTHTYTLVAGTGDTDNASFTITDGKLLSAESFDFESKSSYSVRIKSTDAGGASSEQSFTVNVTNVDEPSIADIADINFDATEIGESTTQQLSIENNGDVDIEVSSITASDGFSVATTSLTIAVGATETIDVVFTPTEERAYNGTITIQSTLGETVVNVVGEGNIVTGIDDDIFDAEEVKLYPNPAIDIVTIDLTLAPQIQPTVAIIDMTGNTKWVKEAVQEPTIKVNVSSYPAGTYLVRISSEKGSVVKKLMVIK